MRLAKSGYFGGNPDNVLNAPASTVLHIVNYESFENEYENAYTEMNKET